MSDKIIIKSLRVSCFVGVPDDEIVEAQELKIDIVMKAKVNFSELNDDIEKTVNYAKVADAVVFICGEKPRRLIETLACDIADYLLLNFPLSEVEVGIDKFILPQTDFVRVEIKRKS
jgi:FolB domain-containing protein